MRPVARWLTARAETFLTWRFPLGRARADVVGYKHSGHKDPMLTAVELKNEYEQLKRGPDQMETFAEYAHFVYMACTPAFAAAFLERNAENPNVNHWDPSLLDQKIKQGGFGLLIVEREKVFEIIRPVRRNPKEANVSRVVTKLSTFHRVELD